MSGWAKSQNRLVGGRGRTIRGAGLGGRGEGGEVRGLTLPLPAINRPLMAQPRAQACSLVYINPSLELRLVQGGQNS